MQDRKKNKMKPGKGGRDGIVRRHQQDRFSRGVEHRRMGVPARNNISGCETGSHGANWRSVPVRLHHQFSGENVQQDTSGEHSSLSWPFLLAAAGMQISCARMLYCFHTQRTEGKTILLHLLLIYPELSYVRLLVQLSRLKIVNATLVD